MSEHANGQHGQGVGVTLDALTQLYLLCQRHYMRPALSLLSESQARYYIGAIHDSPLTTTHPALYELLTSRATRPEYFQTIVDSYMQTANMCASVSSPADVKQAQGEIQDKVFQEIELAERHRQQQQRQLAKERRSAQNMQHQNTGAK